MTIARVVSLAEIRSARSKGKKKTTSTEKKSAIERFYWEVKASGLPELEKELRFHPTRKWRIDYGYSDLKIGLEYEGGTYGIGKVCRACGGRQPGRHATGAGHLADCEKYNEAALAGWLLLRVNNKSIISGLTIDQLKRAYQLRKGGMNG